MVNVFMPNGVRLRLRGTHDQQAPLGATVWTVTVADAHETIAFLRAMGVEVTEATVRETEERAVSLQGWKLDGSV